MNSFEKMQKLAFGKVVTETEKDILTEGTLKTKIKELVHKTLDEAKKKKKEEDVAPQEDIDIEMGAEETPDMAPEDIMSPESTADVDIDPKVKAIQDALNKALANAKALNDEKLINQIGNTITMLVRTQVVGQQQVAEMQGEGYAKNNSDKISYVEIALQRVWNMGRGNNSIDFADMARSIIDDLDTRFGSSEEIEYESADFTRGYDTGYQEGYRDGSDAAGEEMLNEEETDYQEGYRHGYNNGYRDGVEGEEKEKF
jgi:hypothetical protein